MCVGAAFLAVAGWIGVVRIAASAGDIGLLHRHVSWIGERQLDTERALTTAEVIAALKN
jgi:hypothetical protein